ncbi:uncharacterized protein FA14DRAFT_157338 [Meira miltonrushii]|uniref:Uncharacterized protein n=1 Tax=Meira miltonrushii TaxID=1280837 RepID=A0A316V837_9BASI|nr:uncharacterized protein FA14DRAFT_157338 [Meira miltonrushii]PWN32631.1 hypothetical protein FA14DRAFT_157338 [Meira miltonrushii]
MNAFNQSTQLYSTVDPPLRIEPRQIPLPPLFESGDQSYKDDSDTSSNDLPLLNAYSPSLQHQSPSNSSMRVRQGRQSCGRKRGTGAWTEEEDRTLHELVLRYGQKNWVRVEMGMLNRDKKQCRERWFNHVNPHINDGPFTEEESIFIIDFYIRNGRQWAKMSRCPELKDRPDNSIKNHFNTNLREHYAELCQRYGIPRRMQNDVSEIEKDVYERIRGKITAPQYDTMRGTKSSRFLTANEQFDKAPSSEWMDIKSEPSRPTTQDGSPFYWQPDFDRTWSSSSPVKVRDRFTRTSYSAGTHSQSSTNMYKDEEGRYQLPPLPLPGSSARYPGSTPHARERSHSNIDEEHKNRLWQSIQIAHKPSRHNSLTHQFNEHLTYHTPRPELRRLSTPIRRPRTDSSVQAAYNYGNRPFDDSYLTSQSHEVDDVFSIGPASRSQDVQFDIMRETTRHTQYEKQKEIPSPYLH